MICQKLINLAMLNLLGKSGGKHVTHIIYMHMHTDLVDLTYHIYMYTGSTVYLHIANVISSPQAISLICVV
jgi:hypothetical protein